MWLCPFAVCVSVSDIVSKDASHLRDRALRYCVHTPVSVTATSNDVTCLWDWDHNDVTCLWDCDQQWCHVSLWLRSAMMTRVSGTLTSNDVTCLCDCDQQWCHVSLRLWPAMISCVCVCVCVCVCEIIFPNAVVWSLQYILAGQLCNETKVLLKGKWTDFLF